MAKRGVQTIIFSLVLAAFGLRVEAEGLGPRQIILHNPANLRYLQNDILEPLGKVPRGTVLELKNGSVPTFYRFRADNGEIKESTNGFHQNLKLISVPAAEQKNFPQDLIDRWNQVQGGIFLSSVDVNMARSADDTIAPLPASGEPDPIYLKYFYPNAQRRSNPYANALSKRFGAQFNRDIPMSSLPEAEQTKWKKIYQNLVDNVDRTHAVPRSGLFLTADTADQEVALAKRLSEEFEKTGAIHQSGAWSIAVLGTAPRHGFPNAPCAEFQSELIRQAYIKAGYHIEDDFKGANYLIWSNTAAVVNLATALYQSGWIPWDPARYKPKVGAIAMHGSAQTPGHAFSIAGQNGRFLVDNGSPQGRDLFTSNTNKDLIGFMYDIGVFFLPPGIIPEAW